MQHLSPWRAWYLRLRIWLGLRFVRQPAPLQPQLPPPVYNIGFGQTFKLDSTFNEVFALHFVRRHASIPAPKVLGAWWRPDEIQKTANGEIYGCPCYLLMTRMPGVTLGNAWPLMTDKDKVAVLRDLADYVLQLRNIPPPPNHEDRISSITGSAMRDSGLTIWEAVGPFTFHESVDFLMDTWIEDRPAKEERFKEILLRNLAKAGVFCTHADLHFNNIMVHKPSKSSTYRVSGIVDWTSAGWYPVYWEAFNARKDEPQFRDWDIIIPLFAGDYSKGVSILRELHSSELR